MSENYSYILYVGLGMLTQLVILLWGKLSKKVVKRIFIDVAIVVGFLLYMLGRERFHDPASSILIAFFAVPLLLSWDLRKIILPRISEQSILQLLLIFWYVLMMHNSVEYLKTLALIFAFPSLATLAMTFTSSKANNAAKLFFYLWYIIMIAVLAFVNFDLRYFLMAFDHLAKVKSHFLGDFLSGFTFFYLVSHLNYFIEIIPLPSKHQSWSDRWKEVKEYAGLLESKYDDYQLHLYQTGLIILVQGGFLFCNYYFHLMGQFLAVNLSLLLLQIVGIISQRIKMFYRYTSIQSS